MRVCSSLFQDSRGDLAVHRAIDSSDPDAFTALLRRGGRPSPIPTSPPNVSGMIDESLARESQDASMMDASIMSLFKRCILRSVCCMVSMCVLRERDVYLSLSIYLSVCTSMYICLSVVDYPSFISMYDRVASVYSFMSG